MRKHEGMKIVLQIELHRRAGPPPGPLYLRPCISQVEASTMKSCLKLMVSLAKWLTAR